MARILAALSAAILVSAAGSTAFAAESESVLGVTPAQQCAAASTAGISGQPADGQAIGYCTQAIDQRDQPNSMQAVSFLNRGVLYATRGEWQLAVADYNSALELQPTLVEAFIDRGCAYAAQKQSTQAAADFTQALTLAPNRPATVYFDRALAREDSGDLKGAYLDYRKAAQLDPSWEQPKQQLARFTVARPAQS